MCILLHKYNVCHLVSFQKDMFDISCPASNLIQTCQGEEIVFASNP